MGVRFGSQGSRRLADQYRSEPVAAGRQEAGGSGKVVRDVDGAPVIGPAVMGVSAGVGVRISQRTRWA